MGEKARAMPPPRALRSRALWHTVANPQRRAQALGRAVVSVQPAGPVDTITAVAWGEEGREPGRTGSRTPSTPPSDGGGRDQLVLTESRPPPPPGPPTCALRARMQARRGKITYALPERASAAITNVRSENSWRTFQRVCVLGKLRCGSAAVVGLTFRTRTHH
jgi:hypothetical protein